MNREMIRELAIQAGLIEQRLAAGDSRINEAESYVLATQLDVLEEFANLVIAAESGQETKPADVPNRWGFLS